MSVTIAIPFYNAESYLADAIRSVFAQTYQDWELLLIDDGSSDSSLEIARSISDPRVRVISDGKNKKLAARLNEVTRLASHDYIARMDADDLMPSKRIEQQLKILNDNKNFDLVSCGTYSIGNDNSLKGYRGKAEASYTFDGLLTKAQLFLHAGLVARKTWYERNRYDESLSVGQDTELWLRAAKSGDFNAISIAEPLYMYREDGNVTKNKLLRAYELERQKIAPQINSLNKKVRYVAKSYIKTIIILIMAQTGTLKVILKTRKNKVADYYLIEKFKSEIDNILKTKIPGIDHE